MRASPFLVFAVAVHRTAADLEASSFVPEWSGTRRRVAVFDALALRGFLAAPADTCQVTNPRSQRTSRADGIARWRPAR